MIYWIIIVADIIVLRILFYPPEYFTLPELTKVTDTMDTNSSKSSSVEFPVVPQEKGNMVVQRSARLVHIIQVLSQGRAFSAEELSDVFKVDVRTIYRDIRMIQNELHVTIDQTLQTRKYIIRDTHMLLPSVGLTIPEAFSLVVLCNECGLKKNVPFFDTVMSAALKIQGYLPAETNDYIQKTYRNLDIYGIPCGIKGRNREFFHRIMDSNRSHNRIRIVYNSFYENAKIKTCIDIYQLIFILHNWYIIGYSQLHKQVRTFNLGRITDLEVLTEKYEIPKAWSIDKYLRNAWNLIPEQGDDYHVIIDFSRKVGANVEEVQWHKNQKTTWLNESTLRFETQVSGLHEISWWILGYGGEATVVQPPELRTMIAEHVKRMSKIYKTEVKSLTDLEKKTRSQD